MTASEALHHAARRYCIERAEKWRAAYQDLVAGEAASRAARGEAEPLVYGYSSEALRTFPRYNVLDAILRNVERVPVDRLGELIEARRALAEIGITAESPFTSARGEIERSVIDEERLEFIDFVERVPKRSWKPWRRYRCDERCRRAKIARSASC